MTPIVRVACFNRLCRLASHIPSSSGLSRPIPFTCVVITRRPLRSCLRGRCTIRIGNFCMLASDLSTPTRVLAYSLSLRRSSTYLKHDSFFNLPALAPSATTYERSSSMSNECSCLELSRSVGSTERTTEPCATEASRVTLSLLLGRVQSLGFFYSFWSLHINTSATLSTPALSGLICIC